MGQPINIEVPLQGTFLDYIVPRAMPWATLILPYRQSFSSSNVCDGSEMDFKR